MAQSVQKRRKGALGSLPNLGEANSLQLPSLSARQSKVNRHSSSLSSYKLVDYSMSRVKYKAEPLKYLSSKIDFFDPNNQRKLDVSKQKILSEVGAIPAGPKQRPLCMRRRHRLAPEVHSLVQKYLKIKEEREQQESAYMVVGPENLLYC